MHVGHAVEHGARARPSIHGRQRLTMARALAGGASPVSRSRTRSASASGSGASERSVDSSIAAPLVALLEARGEIGGHALHALGADGLDPRLLDRLEHGAGLAARRRRASRAGAGSWQATARAAASAWPRITAISFLVGTRDGSGSRAVLPASPAARSRRSTSTALSAAMERVASVSARLNGIERRLFALAQRSSLSSRPRWRSTAAAPRRSSADRTRRSGRARARRIC